MSEPKHLYWDACVFIAYLNDETESYGHYISHIGQYLAEARKGECRIYCSTILMAEVLPAYLTKTEYGNFTAFLSDFASVIIPISPDPIIMSLAGELRALPYKKGTSHHSAANDARCHPPRNGHSPLKTPTASRWMRCIHLIPGRAKALRAKVSRCLVTSNGARELRTTQSLSA